MIFIFFIVFVTCERIETSIIIIIVMTMIMIVIIFSTLHETQDPHSFYPVFSFLYF